MSTFQNIFVSDTATISSVVCDTLTTNSAISTDTYGGTTVKTNTIIPYTGSSITMNSSNLNVSGNLTVNKNCYLAQSNTASQVLLATSGDYTFIDMYSHSNVANVFPDTRIFSNGGLGNVAGTGDLHIASRDLYLGSTLLTPSSGQGNLFINYKSANIQNEAYCKNILDVTGNILGRANLQVNRNANIVGNLSVGNVLIGNQLTNTANINCANINANGANIGGNIFSGNIYQTFTINSPVNNSIHTTYIEPCLNNSSKFVLIKGNSPLVGYTQIYGADVNLFGNVTCDRGLRVGTSFSNAGDLVCNRNANIFGNINALGNLIVNSDANINNALTIRSGFKGSVATNKFITYDIPVTGTHYFWDNMEITGNLFVDEFINEANLSGNTIVGYNTLNRKIKMGAIDATTQRISFYASSNITAENMNGYIEIDAETNGATTQNRGVLNMVCGNIKMGSVNGQTFILYNKNAELQGNVNILSKLDVLGNTTVANLSYNNLYKNNIRMADCWGGINATGILNNAYVAIGPAVGGVVDQISSPWIRVNKQGQSLTISCQIILSLHTNGPFTNTTAGSFQVQTSTTSAFTTFTLRTLSRCIGAFAQDSYTDYILTFILPTTEEYIRVHYSGNATYTLVGGLASAYLSRYSFRTFI
jgi:hypothetical protein